MSAYLLISHIKIQNANALSSPFTVGFPAMTAWLGAAHALERKLTKKKELRSIKIKGTGVVCHKFMLHAYKGKGDYDLSLISTGNPLTKDGKRPSFVEEARCHLTVSLVLELGGYDPIYEDIFKEQVKNNFQTMKVASGDVLSFRKIEALFSNEEKSKAKLKRSLMPGYGLIERRDIMKKSMKKNNDALDALLDGVKVLFQCSRDDDGTMTWSSGKRNHQGWIIPIATGFHGVSPVLEGGSVVNQRDMSTPHRFAESIVTLGEFRMPYQLEIEELIWRYQYRHDENLYICTNKNNLGEEKNGQK